MNGDCTVTRKIIRGRDRVDVEMFLPLGGARRRVKARSLDVFKEEVEKVWKDQEMESYGKLTLENGHWPGAE